MKRWFDWWNGLDWVWLGVIAFSGIFCVGVLWMISAIIG